MAGSRTKRALLAVLLTFGLSLATAVLNDDGSGPTRTAARIGTHLNQLALPSRLEAPRSSQSPQLALLVAVALPRLAPARWTPKPARRAAARRAPSAATSRGPPGS